MNKIILILMLSLTILFQGCASSLYSVEESYYEVGSEDYIVDLLNDATSTENYTEIINYASDIIDDETSTDTEKAFAYTFLGEALLGSEGVTLVDVISDVVELTTLESSLIESGNIFDLIEIDASSEALLEASNAFASANNLASSSRESLAEFKSSTDTFEMTEDQLILAGITNMLYVVHLIQTYFDVADDGSVSLLDEASTYSEISEDLVDDKSISTYSTNAYNFFVQSNSFSTDQLSILESISTAISEYSLAWAAYSSSSAYVHDSVTYDFSVTESKETTLNLAINAIFQGISV